jgi:Pyruvate/2-oxoacid:ferredoxin oxidoreductase delta subunit
MKVKRKIIQINEERCNGCGQCALVCAEGAIQIVDGKAKLISDTYCDGLGACLGECPQDALNITERQADEFDEEAVEEHLKEPGQSSQPATDPPGSGICPSAVARTFNTEKRVHAAKSPAAARQEESALTHWPVQIRLVPPTAPFLKNAELLVAADCTPVAYPQFHQDFLRGKAVMVGCPKFDGAQAYVEKFAEIFRQAHIKTVTVVVMEVPCCQGLPVIVQKGLELAGKNIPIEKVIISAQGEILQRIQLAA